MMNASDRKELKQLMSTYMKSFQNSIASLQQEIDGTEELDEDTELGSYDADVYTNAMQLFLHLYNPELTSFTLRDYLNLDSGPCEEIWVFMQEHLSPQLFERVKEYIQS
jgi:hypothetical protein